MVGTAQFLMMSSLALVLALGVVVVLRVTKAARTAVRSRELLRSIYVAPSAQVTFNAPSSIRPAPDHPSTLLVAGPADLVIADLNGDTRTTSVAMAEFRMPVEHLESVDALAVADLLAFGADRISGEFRYGKLLSVAVRLRTLASS